jgi:hypothetical protein
MGFSERLLPDIAVHFNPRVFSYFTLDSLTMRMYIVHARKGSLNAATQLGDLLLPNRDRQEE